MAEGGHRPRLHARCAGADPGRADSSARRPFRVRSLPAIQGTERRQDRRADLPPLLQRAHGRSNPGARGRPARSLRHARRTAGANMADTRSSSSYRPQGTVRVYAARSTPVERRSRKPSTNLPPPARGKREPQFESRPSSPRRPETLTMRSFARVEKRRSIAQRSEP